MIGGLQSLPPERTGSDAVAAAPPRNAAHGAGDGDARGDRRGPEDRPLLSLRDLHVGFRTEGADVQAVRGLSLDVRRGESVAVLGESGSGKSVMAQAIMGILPRPPATVAARRLRFGGHDLLTLPEPAMRRLRGRDMALVFQDALASLNPRFTVVNQIAEVLRVHLRISRREAVRRVVRLLAEVGIPAPETRLGDYPHQFSGGMRQRGLIAMALALDPALLIADEPTTALDVTVQAQILDLLKARQRRTDMALLLITHDLAVARTVADRIVVMYAGAPVETGPAVRLLRRPAHPYTAGLVRSSPRAAAKGEPLRPIPGAPPDLRRVPPGCPFHPRCDRARQICGEVVPALREVEPSRHSACHFAEELLGHG